MNFYVANFVIFMMCIMMLLILWVDNDDEP